MKLLLAFAAGVALTSLCFVFLDGPAVTPYSEPLDATTPISSSVSDSVRDISPARRTSTPADRSSEGDSDGAGFPDELIRFAMGNERLLLNDDRFGFNNRSQEELDLMRIWSDEELNAMAERARSTARTQEVLDAERVLGLLEKELRRREQIAEWANSPPNDPVYLSPEFDVLLENAVLRNHHEILQREPIDPTWSNSMETNFLNFFESRPEIADTYGEPTVTCRTSGCEITFLAYGVDAAALASEYAIADSSPAEVVYEAFGAAIRGWSDQPWVRGEFGRVFPPGTRVENGATTIYWPLGR